MPLGLQILLWAAGVTVGGYIISFIVVNALLFLRFFVKWKPEKCVQTALIDGGYDKYRDKIKSIAEKLDKLPNERVYCNSKDGLALSARFYNTGSDKVAVLCHGVHAVPWNNFSVLGERLLASGYDVLIIDERAHGQSQGRFVTYGTRESEDILCWLDFLKSYPAIKEITLCGVSMGGSSVCYIADKVDDERVKTLIIDCAFVSADRLTKEIFKRMKLPYFLVCGAFVCAKLFVKVDMKERTEDHLAKTGIPALFIHGTADKVVNYKQTLSNYSACASKKQLITVDGADHTVATVAGGDEVLQKIMNFIDNKGEQNG